MKLLRSILFICVVTSSPTIFAQIKPKPKPAPAKTEAVTANYELRLKIGAGGQLTLNIVSPNKSDGLEPGELSQLIADLPTGEEKWSERSSHFPNVVVEADPDLTMLDVFNPITLFREDRTNTKVIIPGGPTLLIPIPPKPSAEVKPNPLALFVIVDEKGIVSLNHDPMGKLSDLGALKTKLKAIFHEREQNGVFRQGANEVEKTLTIKIPLLTNKFRDLIALAIAVQEAGSDRVYVEPNFLDGEGERKPLIQ